jgi:hypothetical protein
MFKRSSLLKNRFKQAESKLEARNSSDPSSESIVWKTAFPHIQAAAKTAQATEHDLNYYLRTIKKSFQRIRPPSLNEAQSVMEEQVSQSVHQLTKGPCLIQLTYNDNKNSNEIYKAFCSTLNEHPQLWKLILKNLQWIELTTEGNTLLVSFSANNIEAQQLEGVLKSISLKMGSLVSFSIRSAKEVFSVHLRLETKTMKSFSSERETNL